MAPLAGATALLRADLRDPAAAAAIRAALGGAADVVLSDMAAAATGHAATDHLRIVALAEAAFAIAGEILAPGGTFVAKVFQGGAEGELLARLKRDSPSCATPSRRRAGPNRPRPMSSPKASGDDPHWLRAAARGSSPRLSWNACSLPPKPVSRG